ncbi:hypothetical protein [Candidatus Rickettsiella viridis]|uniref:hypothetical protein n=1 Tax=Candidatus Rickettsiella viridis TaxID=676208 RepID=UPI000F842D4A|nr:hypothetical protein [Candidatus Rickettsiella viridis]
MLVPFESKESARNWLERNRLNTSGTPLLIPFKNAKYDRIEFLKPTGERLRIMGSANSGRHKSRFTRAFVPHISDLEGDTIKIEKERFIIIYEKAATSVGEEFAKLFRSQTQMLRKQIKEAQENDKPRLDPAKVIQDLSSIGVDLDIKAGMSYFIDRENGIEKVYRHTFHSDANNDNLTLYLKTEAEQQRAQPIQVHNNKIENSHFDSFLIDWIIGTIFAMITAIGTGVVGSIFLPVFITAPIAISSFIALSFFSFYKASKDNVKTMEFGKAEFKIIQPNGVTNSMNKVSACQAEETPTMRRNSASVPQQCSELQVLKNRAQALKKQTAMSISFFNSGLRSSVSAFIKDPLKTVAIAEKMLRLNVV